ncbi:MAG: CBASS oligonucleotide cyclase [Thaumarchaeota archaeon]|nr:CBASS oligonucleotide cyclase [Nitrososphaerota archaeon]
MDAGSVAKGTALSTINDLDAAVYVQKDQTPGDESDMVQWIGERLREVYPQKDPGDFDTSLSHCVRIHFRVSGLYVDVVPVLYEGDENDYGYLVDKYTGERLLTSIPLHLEFIRKRKASNLEHLTQVVRLVKWWADRLKDENRAFKCKSFLLELLVIRMVDAGEDLSDYPRALERFFSYIVKTGLEERVAFDDYYPNSDLPAPTGDAIEVFDPVNPANNVTVRYSVHDRNALVEAAEDAADAIREAAYATTGKRATELWQTVLGSSFRGRRT